MNFLIKQTWTHTVRMRSSKDSFVTRKCPRVIPTIFTDVHYHIWLQWKYTSPVIHKHLMNLSIADTLPVRTIQVQQSCTGTKVLRVNIMLTWIHELTTWSSLQFTVNLPICRCYLLILAFTLHMYHEHWLIHPNTTINKLINMPLQWLHHQECGVRTGLWCNFDVMTLQSTQWPS